MTFQFNSEIEARDEAFWQAQERRKKGLLGQPCCTQSKMSWAMIDMPGDFAVVIHGEKDCLNCFHHHMGRSAANYYSTRLTEQQITSGETQAPLRHLLELLVKERAPEVVIVLGTCPVEVIGDRFEVVVDKVSEETGVPMVALHTSGLAMSTLKEMQDWLYDSLAGLLQTEGLDQRWLRQSGNLAKEILLDREGINADQTRSMHKKQASMMPPGAVDKDRCVNVFGMPEFGGIDAEPMEILENMGLQINGFFPHDTSLRQWRSIGHGAATFIADKNAYPRLSSRLEEQYGQKVEEIPLPIGLSQTTRFYQVIAETFGCERDLESILKPHLDQAEAVLKPLQLEAKSMRMAMAIRMLNSYRADQLAYDGLGDFEMLQDAGFDITLFVQGPPEEASKFEASIQAWGIHVPVVVFPGPWKLAEAMEEASIQVACAPDSSHNTISRAGIPMLGARTLRPYFSGLAHNVELLRQLISEAHGGGEGLR